MGKPAKRTSSNTQWQYKIVNNENIAPVLYVGKYGKYLAAQSNTTLLRNAEGKPVPYRDV